MSAWRRALEDRRRIVVPLAVFLLANVGVLALGVLPLQRSVAGQRDTLLTVQQQLGVAKLTVGQAGATRERTEAAEAGLRRFYSEILPQGFDDAVQVTNFGLTAIADRTGVRFERGQFDWEPTEESRLVRMTGQAVLTGDYAGVRRFLHAVETADPFVIIDRIELAQPGDGTATGNQLELLLDISTYYLGQQTGGGAP